MIVIPCYCLFLSSKEYLSHENILLTAILLEKINSECANSDRVYEVRQVLIKPMLMLLLLGLILNNGSEITDVGKIKIYLKPLRELFECFFL